MCLKSLPVIFTRFLISHNFTKYRTLMNESVSVSTACQTPFIGVSELKRQCEEKWTMGNHLYILFTSCREIILANLALNILKYH